MKRYHFEPNEASMPVAATGDYVEVQDLLVLVARLEDHARALDRAAGLALTSGAIHQRAMAEGYRGASREILDALETA